MNEDARRRTLGRGLSALLGEDEPEPNDRQGGVKLISVDMLRPGSFQPRKHFDEESLVALSDSVRERGVLQPLLVRQHPEIPTEYEIIAGERRWRAAQMAQLHEVPVLVQNFSDREALEVALVENIQRADLTPLEEAEGYQRLMDEFDHTQEDLAQAVGKSRSHVANMMRLLSLPDPIKAFVNDGKLSAGHARALLGSSDPIALAEEVMSRGLNVRDTERLTQSSKGPSSRVPRPVPEKDPDTAALERDLANLLGLKVSIDFRGQGGSITIQYRTLEQLDDVLRRLNPTAMGMTRY